MFIVISKIPRMVYFQVYFVKKIYVNSLIHATVTDLTNGLCAGFVNLFRKCRQIQIEGGFSKGHYLFRGIQKIRRGGTEMHVYVREI